LFGYRPADVDAALAVRDDALSECAAALERGAAELEARAARIAELEDACDRISELAVARAGELDQVRAELERLRGEEARRLDALAALATELEAVRRQARGQATRIRLRALRDAAELSERIAELSRRPAEARERLIEGLHAAIARIGVDEGVGEERGGERSLRAADHLFEGLIEIEVGPLADFSQLVGFEDAAGAIAATSQISVKRFASGRATLEIRLAEPVELLAELERRAPFEFRVRERRFDRLVLDLEAETDAEAA
jgi:hypothetical protein